MPKREKIKLALRIMVWDRYIGLKYGETTCFCCQAIKIYQISFECGHVIAHSKGGPTTVENLRPICNSCNKSMGVINMLDYIKSCGKETPKNWDDIKEHAKHTNRFLMLNRVFNKHQQWLSSLSDDNRLLLNNYEKYHLLASKFKLLTSKFSIKEIKENSLTGNNATILTNIMYDYPTTNALTADEKDIFLSNIWEHLYKLELTDRDKALQYFYDYINTLLIYCHSKIRQIAEDKEQLDLYCATRTLNINKIKIPVRGLKLLTKDEIVKLLGELGIDVGIIADKQILIDYLTKIYM